MKKVLFMLAALFIMDMSSSYAQDLDHKAPTLQVGLNGLSLSKGTLDYELIIEMVSEKQTELKLKFVQNLFLNRIDSAGGQTYSYIENLLNAIVTEKNPDLRARQVLEQTVNMAFVVAFSEFYHNRIKPGDRDKITLLANYYEKPAEYSDGLKKDMATINTEYKDDTREGDKKPIISKKSNLLKALMLDIVSEALREDPNLKRLGLMQISRSATYEYLNLYRRVFTDKEFQGNTVQLYREHIKEISDDIKSSLKLYTSNIGLIHAIATQNSFRNADIHLLVKDTELVKKLSTETQTELAEKIKTINTLLEGAITYISLNHSIPDSTRNKQVEKLIQTKAYLKKASEFMLIAKSDTSNASVLSDIIYSINKEFIPVLNGVTYNYPEIQNLSSQLNDISKQLTNNQMKALQLESILESKLPDFILLASRLYEFDKISTYSDFLNYSSKFVDLFKGEKIKTVMSYANTFVKDYTVLKTDQNGKEVLEFNVEDFLSKLQNIRKEKYNPFKFHFTVGVNSGYFKDELTFKGDTLSSFSSISEKIGFKFKFLDFKFTRLRNPGETFNIFGNKFVRDAPPKDPLISDVHLLVYGSGILYSILNTSSNKTFDAPLLGAGLGFSFSNALDFNLSAAMPILPDRSFNSSYKNPMLNIGFDVQISEYLSRVNKKKKAKNQ